MKLRSCVKLAFLLILAIGSVQGEDDSQREASSNTFTQADLKISILLKDIEYFHSKHIAEREKLIERELDPDKEGLKVNQQVRSRIVQLGKLVELDVISKMLKLELDSLISIGFGPKHPQRQWFENILVCLSQNQDVSIKWR